MTPKELFQAGRLSDAIEHVGRDLKAAPGDESSRTFLFELLCFSGDLERARKQLDILADKDTMTGLAVAGYRDILDAERHRRAVFAGSARPDLPVDPPAWLEDYLDAVKCCADGRLSEAWSKLGTAEANRPVLKGQVSTGASESVAFTDFRDGDDRLSAVMEVFIRGGRYFWLPLCMVADMEFTAATKTRDLAFRSVRVRTRDGKIENAYTPVMYAGSERSSETALQLGRATEWLPASPGPQTGPAMGLGQHIFYADQHECSILSITRVDFTP